MRLIDAEPIIAKVTQEIENAMKEHLYGTEAVLMYVLNNINAAQAIDAVPVIRCRDCKYYMPDHIFGHSTCADDGCVRKPNDFCSDAERIEDETNI